MASICHDGPRQAHCSVLNVAMFHSRHALTSSTCALVALAVSVMMGCGNVHEGSHGLKSVAQTAIETTDCDRPPSDRSYVAACVSTGARSNTPILTVSHSTQVITRPVIDDQKAIRLCDALHNVSGVQCR